VLSTNFLVLSTNFLVLSTNFLVLSTSFNHFTSDQHKGVFTMMAIKTPSNPNP
jgi:hypothetical protein